MKRRLISTLLATLMILSVFTVTAYADTADEETSALAAEAVAAETDPAPSADADIPEETALSTDETDPATDETIAADPTGIASRDDDLAATEADNIPKITRAYPSVNGMTVTYTAFDGAAKYMIFMEKPGGGWKKLGETAELSFEQKNPTNNTTYKYTVRAADKDGKFISGYDKAGYSFTYLVQPTLTSVQNINDGQRASWNAVDGAVAYMVYISNGTSWQAVLLTTSTSYKNTDVVSGKKYSYTVRCWDPEKRSAQSFYNRRGISGVYVEAPQITGFTPAKGGVTVQWSASAGAPRYSLFMKSAGKWKKLCNTDGTSYTHTGLTDNTTYTYTVRCINKSGEFVSGYNTAGSEWLFLTPPELTGVKDYLISWKAKEQAAAYRIYRKEFQKSWTGIGKTAKTSFKDTSAAKNTLYTYTVRALDADNNLITHFNSDDTYYYNGNLANGNISVGGTSLYFADGKVRQGYVTVDGKMYYYNSKGVLQKNGLVGSSKEGWRYADKNGVIQLNYTGLASNSAGTWYVKNGKLDRTLRTAVTIGGVDYNILNGKAVMVTTERQRTLFRALKLVDKITDSSMSKSEKLRECWDHLTSSYGEKNPRLPDTHDEGWAELYANDIFVDGTGNCFSYAAAFAYLAKAVGYADCYACNSGGHGWAEVDGLIYDPEWSMHNFTYNYYGRSYSDPCDVAYASALDTSVWWMYVEI